MWVLNPLAWEWVCLIIQSSFQSAGSYSQHLPLNRICPLPWAPILLLYIYGIDIWYPLRGDTPVCLLSYSWASQSVFLSSICSGFASMEGCCHCEWTTLCTDHTKSPLVLVCDSHVMPWTEVQWCPKQWFSSAVSAKLCIIVAGDNTVMTILFLVIEKLQLITVTGTTVDLLLCNTIMIQSKWRFIYSAGCSYINNT